MGDQFGRLTVTAPAQPLVRKSGKPRRAWECACVCGKVLAALDYNLYGGKTSSCGCSRTRHGLHRSRVYTSWSLMLQRCLNPKDKSYKNYGGRGITVCERWHTFDNFLEDMGVPGPGLSIDRVDNNLGYSQDNCRWATKEEQSHNTRATKLTWGVVFIIRTSVEDSETTTRKYGISRRHLCSLIHNERWVDENYVPPEKYRKSECFPGRKKFGHYIGPARTSDNQEPNHDL